VGNHPAACDSWLILGVKDVTSARIFQRSGVETIKLKAFQGQLVKQYLGKNNPDMKKELMNPDRMTRRPKRHALLSAIGLNFKTRKA
jgi:hypothetical protein